jgi:hypothetical protein
VIDFVGTGGPNDGGYETCEIWATGPRWVAPTESTPNPTYPGCTGQAQVPHTALCLRCPLQNSEPATSSPPKGDMRLSGSGASHPASAAIQTANPSEAVTQTTHRP